MGYSWLSVADVKALLGEMKRRKVSRAARSKGGFWPAYQRAGSPRRVPEDWRETRQGFIARHMAQVREQGERLWEDDPEGTTRPTRRHLALVAWAYSPTRARLRRYVARKQETKRRGRAKTKRNAWVRGERGQWVNQTPGQAELYRALRGVFGTALRTEHTVRLTPKIRRRWREDFVDGEVMRYHLDLALPVHRIAIEVDGPEHRHKDKDKDDVRNEILTELGWTIARVSKADAKHRPVAVAEEIEQLVEEHSARGRRRHRGRRGRRSRRRGRRRSRRDRW